MNYLIGLDNGGTVSKAALFDLAGNELAWVSRQTPPRMPRPGYIERDMDELWLANCACLREVLGKSGVSPRDISGVAVCGHGKGLYPWGDGKPAYNGIVSTDNRAWQYPEKWASSGVYEKLYPQLCQKLLPGQPAALLAWFREHDRSVYDAIHWVFSVKDYIRFRLTGEAYSEATDISGSGLMDVRAARFDPALLTALGIPEVFDKLPPLCQSTQLCGEVTAEASALTGLPSGTPVAGGMFDIDACAVAMDIVSPEQLCTITGTWSINEFISETPVTDKTNRMMNSLYAIPGYYLIEECSPTGAGNLDWVLENLMETGRAENPYSLADTLVDSTDPAGDVYYLPFLYGSNRHPLAKAGFVGLTSFHSKADMLRAVYEGVSFSCRSHIEKLLKARSAPAAVRMAGGVVNSPVWVQLFADVLNMPIETVSGVKELGALGAAMSAAVAVGIYSDYKSAAKAMVRAAPAILPNPERGAVYAEKYKKYTAVCEALDGVWRLFEV